MQEPKAPSRFFLRGPLKLSGRRRGWGVPLLITPPTMATITVSLEMARRYPALLAELGLSTAAALAAPAAAAPAPARAAPRPRHCGRCGGTGHTARNSACPGRVVHVADSDDDGECIICCTRNATTTLNPCGHKTMCYPCTMRVIGDRPVCPICRAAVEQVS